MPRRNTKSCRKRKRKQRKRNRTRDYVEPEKIPRWVIQEKAAV